MELLSPAGSLQSLYAALEAGADSVYFGLPSYNARNKIQDFDIEQWIDICHSYCAKAFIAVNILIKDSEMNHVINQIIKCHNHGADAFIICDFGLISRLFATYPDIVVHLSTQAGVFTRKSINFLKNSVNIKRVVLPRELSSAELKLVKNLDVQIEVFAHGAMCVGFSGSCYFSSIVFGDSGNRGRCHQLCRMKYTAIKDKTPLTSGYLLSPKDLCSLDFLNKLDGIDCIKIEGRLKREEYVFQATKVYKLAVDRQKISQEDRSKLKRVFSRGDFCGGYYQDFQTKNYIFSGVGSHLGERVGRVISINSEYLTCDNKKFTNLDGFKIIRNDKEVGSGVYINKLQKIKYSGKVQVGDYVYITTDQRISVDMKTHKKKLPLSLVLTAKTGEKACLSCEIYGKQFAVLSNELMQKAISMPLGFEMAQKQLRKMADSIYYLDKLDMLVSDCYVDIKVLNELRRELLFSIKEYLVKSKKGNLIEVEYKTNSNNFHEGVKKRYAIAGDYESAKYLLTLFDEVIINDFITDKDCSKFYLYLPYFLKDEDIKLVSMHAKNFKGIFANNLYATFLHKNVIIGDVNVFNSESYAFYRQFSSDITLSFELNQNEIGRISCDKIPLVRVYGNLPLMQLNHCPYIVSCGKDCSKCCYDGKLLYVDEKGYNFPIKRIKFKRCYFYLYNSKILSFALNSKCHAIHDYSCYSINDLQNEKLESFTGGHFMRGVK